MQNVTEIDKLLEEYNETKENDKKFDHWLINRKFLLSLLGMTIGFIVARFAIIPAVRLSYVYANNPVDNQAILETIFPSTM